MKLTSICAIFLSIGLIGCGQKALAPPTSHAALCADQATLEQIKKIIFDNAVKTASGDNKLALPGLGAQTKISIGLPVLDGFDEQTQRTSCSGQLQLTFPPGAVKALGNNQDLSADIKYTAQPAADQSGIVYSVLGGDDLIQGIASADLSQWTTRVEPAAGAVAASSSALPMPTQATPPTDPSPLQQTSFDCSKARSFAETTVCHDPELAALDRKLYPRYQNALAHDTDGSAQTAGRAALHALEACETHDCIFNWYSDRLAALDEDSR